MKGNIHKTWGCPNQPIEAAQNAQRGRDYTWKERKAKDKIWTRRLNVTIEKAGWVWQDLVPAPWHTDKPSPADQDPALTLSGVLWLSSGFQVIQVNHLPPREQPEPPWSPWVPAQIRNRVPGTQLSRLRASPSWFCVCMFVSFCLF